MAIFKLFKRKARARTATDGERRKIFWYLKRKSSLTLWQAYADAFSRFAALAAEQAGQATQTVPAGFKLDADAGWKDVAAHAATGLSLFEQGLARLARGDRSVWRHEDGGVLNDAGDIFWHWYTAIVTHGLQGDQPYQGDSLAAIAAALIETSRFAHAVAGIAEPAVAATPAPERWFPQWVQEHALTAPFPDAPAPVPIAPADVTIDSGGTVPLDGIYEPLQSGGSMNYLLAGTVAPAALLPDKAGSAWSPQPVLWKLVWEDTRYQDGDVPAEEAFYLGQGAAPAGARRVRIFNHFTGADFLDIDDATGDCLDVDSDEGEMASALSIARRHHCPIGGSYAVEDGRRYAMYWSDGDTLVFRTPEGERFELFRCLDDGRFAPLIAGVHVTLSADGNSGWTNFRLIDADGGVLHELRYHSLRYQYAIGMNFTAGPDEDLSDWDFFLALQRGIEELTALAG